MLDFCWPPEEDVGELILEEIDGLGKILCFFNTQFLCYVMSTGGRRQICNNPYYININLIFLTTFILTRTLNEKLAVSQYCKYKKLKGKCSIKLPRPVN